jgi:hypothetical protein
MLENMAFYMRRLYMRSAWCQKESCRIPYSEDIHGYFAERLFRMTYFPIRGHFWPLRSPDLTASDTLKVYVLQARPARLEELKSRIREETAAISQEGPQKAVL